MDADGLTDTPPAKCVVCPNSLLPTVPICHPPPGGLYGRDGDADADGLRDSDAELDGLVDALGLRDADGLRDMIYPKHTTYWAYTGQNSTLKSVQSPRENGVPSKVFRNMTTGHVVITFPILVFRLLV